MAVLDANGRPMKAPKKADMTEELAGPSVGSVRSIQTAHPADGLTPQRLGSLLREAETGDATAYLELAEQMEEKDLHYAGVLGVRKRAIRKLKLLVDAGGEDQASEDAAALLRDLFNSPAIKDDLIDMLDGLGKGFSATELMWDVSKAPWTIAKLKHRDPRWFRFDPIDGETLLLRENTGDVPLQQYRFSVHVPRLKSGLPIRGGLARLVTWGYIFKNYTLKDWAVFMEAYGHPLRIGKYGTEASPEQKAMLMRAVRRLGVDMAAIMPKSMEVEIVNGAVTNGDKMFESSARFWDEQVSKAVLGQVATTDAIAGGHAVGKVQNEVRDDIRDADADQLAATIMRDIAAPLTSLNYASAECPIVRFEEEERHDPRMVLLAIKEFGPLGLKVSERQVRDAFGLREPEEGEAVLQFQPKAPTAVPVSEIVTQASAIGLPARDSLQGMLDRLMGLSAEGATDPMLGGIIEAMQTATDMDEVRGILEQLALAEPDEVLVDLIARLGFASRLSGETGSDIGRN